MTDEPPIESEAVRHASFGEAFLAAQREARAVQADALNEGFKKNGKPSKYVPLETLMPAVLPLLGRHGLTWTTRPTTKDGQPALYYRLALASDPTQADEDTMPLLGVTNMQQLGGAITYGRRQALMAVLGLVAEKDDDGTAATRQRQPSAPGASRKLTPAERTKITAVMTDAGMIGDKAKNLLTAAGIVDFNEITRDEAFKLRELIDLKARRDG